MSSIARSHLLDPEPREETCTNECKSPYKFQVRSTTKGDSTTEVCIALIAIGCYGPAKSPCCTALAKNLGELSFTIGKPAFRVGLSVPSCLCHCEFVCWCGKQETQHVVTCVCNCLMREGWCAGKGSHVCFSPSVRVRHLSHC